MPLRSLVVGRREKPTLQVVEDPMFLCTFHCITYTDNVSSARILPFPCQGKTRAVKMKEQLSRKNY